MRDASTNWKPAVVAGARQGAARLHERGHGPGAGAGGAGAGGVCGGVLVGAVMGWRLGGLCGGLRVAAECAGFVGALIELLAQQSTHKPLIHKRKQEEIVTRISHIDRFIPQELRDTLSWSSSSGGIRWH